MLGRWSSSPYWLTAGEVSLSSSQRHYRPKSRKVRILTKSLETGENRRVHWKSEDRAMPTAILKR
jgi:hypothetical protein